MIEIKIREFPKINTVIVEYWDNGKKLGTTTFMEMDEKEGVKSYDLCLYDDQENLVITKALNVRDSNAMKSALPRLDSGLLQSYAWPGGYPIYYLDGHNCVICPDCANAAELQYRLDLLSDVCNWVIDPMDDGIYFDRRDRAIDAGANYEDDSLYCEACNGRIESAYGDDEEEEV